jgi:hypothetical protein
MLVRVLLAGGAEARQEYVSGFPTAHTPGDPARPVVIAGDFPVYWKPANLTSILFTPIFTPTHPNILRLRPTPLD